MKIHGNRFLVSTNGCQRRSLDADKLIRYILANQGRVTNNPKLADCIFFISCGFDSRNQKDSATAIELFHGINTKVFVLGCLPSINPSLIRKDLIQIPTKDIGQLDNHFSDLIVKWDDVEDSKHLWTASLPQRLNTSNPIQKLSLIQKETFPYIINRLRNTIKGHIRVSWGCVSNCSYCGIRLAIGQLKSKPLEKVVGEYVELLKSGIRKFVILGDNAGAYGIDINSNFAALLQSLDEASDGKKVKWLVRELHPIWVVKYEKELKQMIKQGRISSLHIPVQSGSEKILKLMHRPLKIDDFKEILYSFRRENPKIRFETHIIVGFPQESDDDFQKTVDLIKDINFYRVDVFKYTDVNGTEASKMAGKIPELVIEKRAAILEQLSQRK